MARHIRTALRGSVEAFLSSGFRPARTLTGKLPAGLLAGMSARSARLRISAAVSAACWAERRLSALPTRSALPARSAFGTVAIAPSAAAAAMTAFAVLLARVFIVARSLERLARLGRQRAPDLALDDVLDDLPGPACGAGVGFFIVGREMKLRSAVLRLAGLAIVLVIVRLRRGCGGRMRNGVAGIVFRWRRWSGVVGGHGGLQSLLVKVRGGTIVRVGRGA